MKRIIIAICVLMSILLIIGCSPDIENSSVQSSDNMSVIDNTTEDSSDDEADDSTDESDEDRTATDNQALIDQLMAEQNLDDETDEDDNETEEESNDGNWTIELIHMKGEPEKDITINAGDSVIFISRQPNYVHRIQLREKLESGAFNSTLLDPAVPLTEDDEFTYTFEETGKFQWYSKTNYPTTSGYITVE